MRFRSRATPRASGREQGNIFEKKKGKRKSKIIPRSIFSKIDERKIVKGDTKMSSFFFLFLADRFTIQLERVN